MTRIVEKRATKGSRRWLQELVNRKPKFFEDILRSPLQLGASDRITWLSPLESDDYAEYQDQEFLDLLSVSLKHRDLDAFWPLRGPVWDGLGKSSRGDIILLEAKAHAEEPASSCEASSPQSLSMIKQSIAKTAEYFSATSTDGWTQGQYQYASRLAHLYLLWQLNKIPAWLVFIYFINDAEVGGPKSAREWEPALDEVYAHLGVRKDRLGPHVVDIFIDVTTI